MDMSNMKNIVVLKNLPSNVIEEAIVVIKENKKIKDYQKAEIEKGKIQKNRKNIKDITNKEKNEKIEKEYIVKEAEMVIANYISELEQKSAKGKSNFKILEKKYKKSLQMNFLLGFVALVSIFMSIVI